MYRCIHIKLINIINALKGKEIQKKKYSKTEKKKKRKENLLVEIIVFVLGLELQCQALWFKDHYALQGYGLKGFPIFYMMTQLKNLEFGYYNK